MSESLLYLTHDDDGLPVTRAEFSVAEAEVPWRYERHHGELVVIRPADHMHHRTVSSFFNQLAMCSLNFPDIVEHVFQNSWTYVEDDTDRLPDIAVYLWGREGQMPERVPDLVFEILDVGVQDRRRDYEEKREEYERIGVTEYVIVDRFDHRVTVLTLKDGSYRERMLGPDDVYTSSLLPGLEIPLSDVI